jgi:hypothetical protein
MNLRYTAKAGARLAGKTVDRHRSEAFDLIADGLAVTLDPIDNIERQIIAEKIEARKASQLITVMHITPEDLDESKSEIE